MKTLFTAHGTTTGGRTGHTESDDKTISMDLASPGSGKKGTNPEQLFACGYSACFGSAIDHVAKSQKLTTGEITVKADVSLNQDEKEGFSIAVTLNVTLPELDASAAKKLVEEAHKVCPYSKATRGNVEVKLVVNDSPIAKAA
jgi:osmotically inducible protein OsmC